MSSCVKVNENDANDTDVMKGETMNAFEALMSGARTGDTQKRTPVRKRVKRLENITSSNTSILNWATKSARKGTTLVENADQN